MKKAIAILLIFIMTVSALSVCASATGEAAAASGPADTGDMFGMIIVALLVSAVGVAVLVACRTRFTME